MVRFSPEFRQNSIEHREKALKSDDPNFLLGTTRVDVTLLEDVKSVATMGGFTWSSDEPPDRGGANTAPNPLSYFVSGLGLCQMVHFAREAVLMEIPLDSIKNTVRGRFSRVPPRLYKEFIYDLRIESPAAPERIKEMVEVGERNCFVSNTLSKAAKLTGNIYLNGVQIHTITRGPEPA